MASGPSAFSQSPGGTDNGPLNFLRISRLFLEIATDILRQFLQSCIVKETGQGSIGAFLTSHITKIRNLGRSGILHKRQIKLLFQNGKPCQDLLDWDISILSCILTNCCALNQSEIQAVDNIRQKRNSVFAHRVRASINDAEFHPVWNSTTAAINVVLASINDAVITTQVTDNIKEVLDDGVEVSVDILRNIKQQLDRLVSLERAVEEVDGGRRLD